MAIYNVVMGQGVSVRNLPGNALSTGLAGTDQLDVDSQRLSTCSAVILGNTQTKAAGLYHFPMRQHRHRPALAGCTQGDGARDQPEQRIRPLRRA